MASMRNILQPSEELLNSIRLMPACQEERSAEVAKSIREGSYTISQSKCLLGEWTELLGAMRVEVSRQTLSRIFRRKYRLLYRVLEGSALRLECTEIVEGKGVTASRTLEAVHKYEPGNWENELALAYRACLNIRSLRKQIPLLEAKLREIEDPQKVVQLIGGTSKPNCAISFLLSSPNYDSNCARLYMAYVLIGKVIEARDILLDSIRLHPEDAQLSLALANLYWAALCNATGWGEKVDIEPLKRVTLTELGCSYESARSFAEARYTEAMRLSGDREVRELARQGLVSLRMTDDMYDRKEDK